MAVMSVHHPLAFTFGILGNAISFMVYLAPLPTFVRIYKKKCTESFQALPYLVALFSCMMWLYYAMLKKDALLLITINSFGCLIETLYISLYIAYAPKVNRAWTIKFMVLVNMGLFSSILLVTHFLVKGSARVQILGWICVAISVAVFAAPLNIVAQVIRTKSVEFMPITLSVFLTLSAVMWLAYGLFSKDICVALPNVVGFTLGVVQMLLYAFYRKGKTVVTQEERLKGTGVVAATLENSEVYPTKEQQGPEPTTTNHQSLQIPSQHITHESPV